MGEPSALRAAANDRRAEHALIRAAAKRGPLRSLSERELDLRPHPVTIYPYAAQRTVLAWVHFGAGKNEELLRVRARLVRNTPLAAGIEFFVQDEDGQRTTYRRWLRGNAVHTDDRDGV